MNGPTFIASWKLRCSDKVLRFGHSPPSLGVKCSLLAVDCSHKLEAFDHRHWTSSLYSGLLGMFLEIVSLCVIIILEFNSGKGKGYHEIYK